MVKLTYYDSQSIPINHTHTVKIRAMLLTFQGYSVTSSATPYGTPTLSH